MPKSKGRRKPKRATPQPPQQAAKDKVSPTWYVVVMFGLMAIGTLVIILNYIGLMPGGAANSWLFIGLAGIGAGFVMTLWYY